METRIYKVYTDKGNIYEIVASMEIIAEGIAINYYLKANENIIKII